MSHTAKSPWAAPEVHLLRSAQSAEIGTAQDTGETTDHPNASAVPSGNV